MIRFAVLVMVGTPIAGALAIGAVACWLLLYQPYLP